MKPKRQRSKDGAEIAEAISLKSANADTGYLSGYASKFWVVDSYGECTAPGCFQTSIKERGPAGADRIALRYEHYVTCGKATKLEEDAEGLIVEAYVKDDGAAGSTLRSHLAEPHPLNYGLSIGFRRQVTRPANDTDPLIFDFAPAWIKRYLESEGVGFITVHTETKLEEFSAVTFPAVDNATVTDYRSEISSLLTDLKAGRLSDEEIASLKELTDAWLADVRSGNGETPKPEPEPQTAVRNHRQQIALLEAQAKVWGVPFDGVAHA